jgi:hypothetical protein
MLKFALGFASAATLFGMAIAQVARDEELWNEFIEDTNRLMGRQDDEYVTHPDFPVGFCSNSSETD